MWTFTKTHFREQSAFNIINLLSDKLYEVENNLQLGALL